MFSGTNGATDEPPGNGNAAPEDNRTSRAFAWVTIGASALPSATAPIQVNGAVPGGAETGLAVNASEVSAGAGAKSGCASRRKCVKGSGFPPRGGFRLGGVL